MSKTIYDNIGKLVYTGGYGNIYEYVCKDKKFLLKKCKILKGNLNELKFNQMLMENKQKHSKLLMVPKYCNFLDKDSYYIIMEWNSKFKTENCYKTVFCLKHLHNLGFVHGDVKFSNFVQKNADVKLIDFGMVHEIDSTQNKICGTPLYMSINSYNGITLPQNDFESLLYSIVEIFAVLPWYKLCKFPKNKENVLDEKIKFKKNILNGDFQTVNSFKFNTNFDLLKFAKLIYKNNLNYHQLSQLLLFLKDKR